MTHNYQFQSVTFFNWDSLHAKLNSHYKAWSFKKKEKVKDIGQMYSEKMFLNSRIKAFKD